MSCRIIEGHEMGRDDTVAVLFDSVTGKAFGPLFKDAADASAFMEWLEAAQERWVVARDRLSSKSRLTSDPRAYSDCRLDNMFCEFRKENEANTARLSID